jgi:hypothetical protein
VAAGALTVGGSIEDLGWCAYSTISEFFSVAPDGKVDDA